MKVIYWLFSAMLAIPMPARSVTDQNKGADESGNHTEIIAQRIPGTWRVIRWGGRPFTVRSTSQAGENGLSTFCAVFGNDPRTEYATLSGPLYFDRSPSGLQATCNTRIGTWIAG